MRPGTICTTISRAQLPPAGAQQMGGQLGGLAPRRNSKNTRSRSASVAAPAIAAAVSSIDSAVSRSTACRPVRWPWRNCTAHRSRRIPGYALNAKRIQQGACSTRAYAEVLGGTLARPQLHPLNLCV